MNYKITTYIKTPDDQTFVVDKEVNYRSLMPIHENKHPWISDHEESNRARKERECFIEWLSKQIAIQLTEGITKYDTINGYKLDIAQERFERVNKQFNPTDKVEFFQPIIKNIKGTKE